MNRCREKYVAYSYRSDPTAPRFDDSVPLIIFDGKCVLCSSGVQWMISHDSDGATRFAAIQEPVSQALYNHYGLDADAFDTFMVLVDGVPHLRWDGMLAAGKLLPGGWKVIAALGRMIPNFIGDRLYDFVQRHRIGWFGARETCLVQVVEMQSRFLSCP